MPKGIYQRTPEMQIGKYERTEKHLEILKQQIKYALQFRNSSCGFQKGHLPFKNCFKKGNKPIAPFKKGHVAWNKGTHNSWNKGKKFYHPKQFKKGVYQGYGFKKGFTPWNKGTKGVCKSWCKGKKIQLNTGRTHFKKGCIGTWKGKKLSEEHIKNIVNSHKGIPSGKKGKHYKHLQGKNSSNWQGGISNKPYSFYFNEELKEKIRKRDNYECQICHITEEEHLIVLGEVLSIHHIDYNKENYDEDKLATLCRGCNARVNFNKEHWKEYFQTWKLKLLKIMQ